MTHVHKTIIVTWQFRLDLLQSCLEINETKQRCVACYRFVCAPGFHPLISSLVIRMYSYFIKKMDTTWNGQFVVHLH